METKKIVLWVIVGVLIIVVLYTTLIKGNVQNTQTIGQVASSASGMVGGC